MPGKKRAEPKSSFEIKSWPAGNPDPDVVAAITQAQQRLRALDCDPATFAELLRIAAGAGVTEFTAGPFTVKFSQSVANNWTIMNRPIVDGKGRPV